MFPQVYQSLRLGVGPKIAASSQDGNWHLHLWRPGSRDLTQISRLSPFPDQAISDGMESSGRLPAGSGGQQVKGWLRLVHLRVLGSLKQERGQGFGRPALSWLSFTKETARPEA